MDVQSRVFDKAAILRIAAAFATQAGDATNSGLEARTEFELVSTDGTTYESDQIDDVFGDETAIDLAPTRAISMHFFASDGKSYERVRDISISLTHGRDSGQLVVRGNDHGWVVAIFADFRRVIESVRPQVTWPQHQQLIFQTGAILGGFAQLAVIHLVARLLVPKSAAITVTVPAWVEQLADAFRKAPALVWLLNVFQAWLQGLWFAFWLQGFLRRMWPSIEFDLGPEHLRVERRRQKQLRWIATAVVLPLLIRTAYDLAKKW